MTPSPEEAKSKKINIKSSKEHSQKADLKEILKQFPLIQKAASSHTKDHIPEHIQFLPSLFEEFKQQLSSLE